MPTVFANTYISGLIDEITMASGSIYFNGSTDYLTLSNTPFNFGTNSFTVDFWHYYVAGNSTYNTIFDNGSQGVFLSFDTSTKLLFYGVPAQGSATGYAHGMSVNTWNHIAFVRNGTTLTIYVNGNSIGSWTGITGSMSGSGVTAYIGQYSGGGPYYINGNISNFRVVNGRALYTSNFTPSPGPSFPVGNTSLLLSVQPNVPFKDTSNNNLTITRVGTPTFNSVGPFNPAPPSTGTSQNVPMSQLRDGTIMISGFYDEVGDFTSAPSYAAGLYKTTYNGYFSDTPTWFATATPTTFGANPATSVQTTIIEEPASDDGSNFSVQWLGYFLPATTETYTFYTSSDDGSFMWIGANALSGFTTGNATVSNGGAHAQTETSGTAALTAGVYYPIRIQFGEIGGGDVMSFNFSTATITKTTNVTGRVFYNPATNGF